MHHTNDTPKSGNPYCLNPDTGKWELPTHYIAYDAETSSWGAPISAAAAAEQPADTILTPILTGKQYGEQTTAGVLAAWLNNKPENPSPISITADTTYHFHDAASDTWSATTYTLGELMRLPDTSASTLIRPAGSETAITLAQARQYWKAAGKEETSTGKTPTEQQSARQSQNETDHLNQLPSEIRAADYLLRHTQLADTIAAAKEFFQKAAAFITFVLILNIAAIIILLIAFMVSASK